MNCAFKLLICVCLNYVTSSPEIFWTENRMSPKLGDNISVTCSYRKRNDFDLLELKRRCSLGKESMEESLMMNDQPENDMGPRYKIEYAEAGGRAMMHLNIANVTGYDGCTFQCANEEYGDLRANVTVAVKGVTKIKSVVITKGGETFVNEGKERQKLDLYAGQVKVIGCQLVTNQHEQTRPEAYLDKKKLTLKTFNNSYQKERQIDDVTYLSRKEFYKVEGLTIDVQHNDNIFMCVHHGIDKQDTSFKLNILYPPVVKLCSISKLKNQMEGRAVVCEVASNPIAGLKIKKDGVVVNGSDYNVTEQMLPGDSVKFVISQRQVNVSSMYEFVFNNTIGKVVKNIQFRDTDANYDDIVTASTKQDFLHSAGLNRSSPLILTILSVFLVIIQS